MKLSAVNNCVGERVLLEMETVFVSVVNMFDPSAGISAKANDDNNGIRQISFFIIGLLQAVEVVRAQAVSLEAQTRFRFVQFAFAVAEMEPESAS